LTAQGYSDLAGQLVDWFRSRNRDVPWRAERDPYRIWVAEVMAQQTRIAVVRERYDEFLASFPDIESLAAAELDTVLKAWEGLGYYARARNLHRAANEIVTHHGGRLPREPDALRELPGIGPYTAGAVASLAFGRSEPAVDGNVRRVLSRRLDVENPSAAMLDREVRLLLAAAEAPPGEVNQALMDLGGEVCKPRSPRCEQCPLADGCLARARGTQAERPGRLPRRELPHHPIAVAVVRRRARILIGKRPTEGLLGGLWEFPGGKIEPGEAPETAAARELREEMCIKAVIGRPIAVVPHAYSHFRITLHAFEAEWTAGEPCGRAVSEWKWVRPDELRVFAFPAANRPILEQIR
jgi:A/G-specific adenine glycosylase